MKEEAFLQGLSLLFLEALSLFTRRCDPQHRGVKLLPIWGGVVALFTLSESSLGWRQGCALGCSLWVHTLTGPTGDTWLGECARVVDGCRGKQRGLRGPEPTLEETCELGPGHLLSLSPTFSLFSPSCSLFLALFY